MSSHPRGRFLAAALTAVAVVVSAVLLTSCADTAEPDPAASVTERAEEAIDEGAVVIDVRTADEFEDGHVVDARNIDVTAPTFAEEVSALDVQESYVVYCRSGERSAAAAQQMRDLGFARVIDAGAFADLADAGVATR